ncbi:MAG: glycosyltransferase family 39 protein [bacterium]
MRKTIQNLPALIMLSIFVGVFLFMSLGSIFASEFWYDEAFTGIVIRQDWGEMFKLLQGDVHPPLYYTGLKLYSMSGAGGDGLLRSFSILAGIGLILIAYFLTKKITESRRTSLAAAFVFAVNPFILQYATEARMYTWVALFVLVGFYFFLDAIKVEKLKPDKNWYLATLFFSLAFLTHYISVFVIFILWLASLFILNKKVKVFSNLGKYFIFYFRSYLPLIITLILWVSYFHNHIKKAIFWIPPVNIWSIPEMFYAWLLGTEAKVAGVPKVNELALTLDIKVIFVILTVVIVWLLSVLIFRNHSANRKDVILLAVTWLFPLLFLFFGSWFGIFNMFVSRYFLPVASFFLISFIILLARYYKKVLLWVFLFFYMIAMFLVNYKLPETHFAELAAIIEENAPAENLVFGDGYSLVITKYYLGNDDEDRILLYNIDDPYEDFDSWQVINNKMRLLEVEDIPEGSLIIAQKDFSEEYSKINEFWNYGFYKK